MAATIWRLLAAHVALSWPSFVATFRLCYCSKNMAGTHAAHMAGWRRIGIIGWPFWRLA
jgi:hypothetical protein